MIINLEYPSSILNSIPPLLLPILFVPSLFLRSFLLYNLVGCKILGPRPEGPQICLVMNFLRSHLEFHLSHLK